MNNLAEKIEVEQEFETQALTLYQQAVSTKVIDQDSFALAGEFGKSLKVEIERREKYFEPLRVKAKAGYDEVLKMKKDAISPLEDALKAIRATINSFLQEQEHIRQEEERVKRLALEEAARKEQERLLAQAAKAEEKGKTERAEELLDRAENVYVAPVTVAPKVETAKFEGGAVGQVKELQVSVTDLKAFISELVKRNMAPTMVEVKAGALKSWVKANDFKAFPGLHINETVSVRVR